MTIRLPTAQEVADEIHKCGGSDFHRDGKQRLGYGVNGTVEIIDDYLFKDIEREAKSNGR